MRIIVSSDSEFVLPAGAEAAGLSLLRLGVDVALPAASAGWGFPDWSRWVRATLPEPGVTGWGVVAAGVHPALCGACVMELKAGLVDGSGPAARVLVPGGSPRALVPEPPPAPDGPSPPRSAVNRRAAEAPAKKRPAPPLPTTGPLPGAGRDHRIPAMRPSARWRLYIDETGSKFGGQPGGHDQIGRFVVIAWPSGDPLRSNAVKPDFHAVDANPAKVALALSGVLQRGVGILGVSSTCVPETADRDYAEGLYATMLLALRLLPIPTKGTVRVEIFAEERSGFKEPAYWEGLAHALQRELHLGDPDRGNRTKLRVRDVPKGRVSGTAMADAVAYAWATTRPATATLRERWGNLGACLLEDPRSAEALRRAYGTRRPGRALPPGDWLELFTLAEAGDPGAPVGQLLAGLAEDARGDTRIFRSYLDAAGRSLEAKGYDLRLLQLQAAWLGRAAPDGWTPPPRLALLLAMHALATGNHAGHTTADAERAVLALLDDVWEEDIKLACLAALHVAVRRTNRFEFAAASAALADLVEVPALALGPNLSGRLWSSLGQHTAFQGDAEAAIAAFDTALSFFDRISDPRERAAERAQTMTYRTISLLDGGDDAACREGVAGLVGGLEPERLRQFAGGGDDASRWHHHVVVRYLAENGDAEAQDAYITAQPGWGGGRNHPWPLIHTYRAVLLHGRDVVGAHAEVGRALGLLAGASGTLAIMRAGIERVAARMGLDVDSPTELSVLRRGVPAAGPWLDALEALPDSGDPLDPLRAALPFNFR